MPYMTADRYTGRTYADDAAVEEVSLGQAEVLAAQAAAPILQKAAGTIFAKAFGGGAHTSATQSKSQSIIYSALTSSCNTSATQPGTDVWEGTGFPGVPFPNQSGIPRTSLMGQANILHWGAKYNRFADQRAAFQSCLDKLLSAMKEAGFRPYSGNASDVAWNRQLQAELEAVSARPSQQPTLQPQQIQPTPQGAPGQTPTFILPQYPLQPAAMIRTPETDYTSWILGGVGLLAILLLADRKRRHG